MTTQTSGSIPITLGSDPSLPIPSHRETHDSSSEHTAAALRKLIGRSDSAAQHKSGSKHASSIPDYESSAAEETVSSFPSEQSHMMAVTDEEMVLLEMMRNKRAAMQKSSFAEGYQQALKREQDQLILRRQSAQKTALDILKQKRDKTRESQANRIDEEGLDDEHRRRLSTLRQEDVDSRLKIDRFFAMETPLENVFPEPPTRSYTGSEQHSNAPIEELLLPTTYTPRTPQSQPRQQPHQHTHQKTTASPLLPSPSTLGTAEEELDETAQLEADLSRFLASGGRAESSAFPLPPRPNVRESHRKSHGMTSLLSPSLSPTEEEEDVVFPRRPSRSPNRLAVKKRTPSPQPLRSTKPRAEDESTALFSSPSTTGASTAEYPESTHIAGPAARRGHYTSIISSYQYLDPNHGVPDMPVSSNATGTSSRNASRNVSPSLSTSRASPMTPTFTSTARVPHPNVEIASSDNPSPRTYASSDQFSLRLESHHKHDLEPLPPALKPRNFARKPKKAAPPPPLEPSRHDPAYDSSATARVGSVSSFTSASEDVLAAWAELGGGNEGFVSRSRSRLPAH